MGNYLESIHLKYIVKLVQWGKVLIAKNDNPKSICKTYIASWYVHHGLCAHTHAQ